LIDTVQGRSSIEQVVDAFRTAKAVTAICHENPDADTLGAAIAIAIIAERLGAESEVVSVDRPAPAFAFLPRIEEIRPHPRLAPDLAVICDAATLDRVGRIADDCADWFARARILNIDHHVTNEGFGHLNYVEPQAAATCEVVARLLPALAVELDAELASALLTGIVRDTHGFSDSATSGDTLRTAASLVDAGAPLSQIHRSVLAEMPYGMMALWGLMLSRIGQLRNGRIVYVVLTQQLLDQTGTQQHDADGIAEFIANAKGADMSLLVREIGPDKTRVSIRTTGAVDATRIAARFDGGGHARRAGFSIGEPLLTALPRVLGAATNSLA
jgi:phosphoesterase RecJ-like protein